MQTLFTRAAVIVFVGLALQPTAQAQANYRATSQPSPTFNHPRLSPYLNLLRADNSLLSPYHSFVQPRQEIQQSLSRQASRIGQLEQTPFGPGATDHSSAANRLQTGRAASFNNYLHYYRFNKPLHSK